MPIPDGWVPRSEYPKAPPKWNFWTLDGPDSDFFIGEALRRSSIRIAIAFGIMTLGLILTLVGTLASEGGYVVFWGAVAFGLIDGIRLIRKRITLKATAIQELYRRATAWRQLMLREEYSATR
ncbi:hypothetical protein ACFQZV_05875 [Microbacterium koreense]|uniref:DUF3040 domain-containing protein n=1 Tax=Microbacterium koreense TaxID=323761 RepID=A0ABW2ZQB0_9MICO